MTTNEGPFQAMDEAVAAFFEAADEFVDKATQRKAELNNQAKR